jgi:hypothetical protein
MTSGRCSRGLSSQVVAIPMTPFGMLMNSSQYGFQGMCPQKGRRVQWADLPIWTMLFVTAIGGRPHEKEQAQADAQSSPKTARP